MEREQLHTLIKALRNSSAHLPLHQKALREQLLRAHAARPKKRRTPCERLEALHARLMATVFKKAVPLGIALVLAIVLLGLLLVLPSNRPPSSERLIAKTPIANPAVPDADAGVIACEHAGTCPDDALSDPQSPPATTTAGNTASKPSTVTTPSSVAAPPTASDTLASVVTTLPDNTSQTLVAAAIEAVVTPADPAQPITIDINVDQTLTGKTKTKEDKAAKVSSKILKQLKNSVQGSNAQ